MAKRFGGIVAAMTMVIVFFLVTAGPASAEMIVLSPTADSYTDTAKATTNFGRDKTLISRYDSNNEGRNLIFLRFDISSIPRASTISEATLKIYLKEMTVQKTISLGVFRTTSDWSETVIHSQNKPTGPGPITTNAIAASPGYKSFDLTEVFTGWLGGTFPNYGVFLGYQGKKNFVAVFNSRDALSSQPQLLVYYTPPSSGIDRPGGMPMASGRAPLISEVKASNVKNGNATITWKTDGMTTSKVRYGLSAAYDQMATDPNETLNHSLIIPDLKSGQTYHFRIYGRNKAGLESMSADFKLITPNQAPVKQPDDTNRWGWLKLIAMALGILILLVLGVVIVFEFPRWRRGEFKLRDVAKNILALAKNFLKSLPARFRG
jgi:hypothetical protein